MIYQHQPAPRRLKSRKSFLHCDEPLNQPATQWKLDAWEKKLEKSPPNPAMPIQTAETLPPGSNAGWTSWQCLNHLRTGVARTKCSLLRWGFIPPTASTLCECGNAEDTVYHRLQCHLLDEPCSTTDLAEFNQQARQCVNK